ncbi:uncharacterized protein EV422DRAFT_521108 [Fimicolochytrium jonesii]|uniref:uncharacterized protein n=1 Tax=Fimicolochytrium jonesii TaxID=1396493 RepID=UPI0022FDED74|nr:uncharacterized protein EV422DRAFT_521108 [Fimicolochytrium jonesii]KAI8823458.1 hypothetical protein EV422DRAFT_521108 [Fimicolochytrium jonesii]
MTYVEKQILDHIGYFIRSQNYRPSPEEARCIKVYDSAPLAYGLANFVMWGSLAYYTLDFRAFFATRDQLAMAQQDTAAAVTKKLSTPPPPASAAPNGAQAAAQTIANSAKAAAIKAASRTRPVQPLWITLWGVAAITGGAFASTYYSSKLAARQCIQCFLDVEDKKSGLYRVTRQLLKEHNPDHGKFFAQERHKEMLMADERRST